MAIEYIEKASKTAATGAQNHPGQMVPIYLEPL